MAQVSKRVLSKTAQERIFEIFWQSLASCSNQRMVANFLEDLLTPTEKIMLAKRVSIAFLLIKGYNYKSINSTLKVSDPTIWNVNLWLKEKGAGYKLVLGKILKSKQWRKFWQEIENKIEDSFPPPYGTNWKEARRKQWEKRRAQQKPF